LELIFGYGPPNLRRPLMLLVAYAYFIETVHRQ
jgi:hypothetical protein